MSAADAGIPAATLVLFRQPGKGDAEHLMIKRASQVSFAAGALVFPGGRVEPEDFAIAQDPALAHGAVLDGDDAAARVAAIRETVEEVGVATAITPAPGIPTIREWRARLAGGGSFAALLAAANARIQLDQLVPFSRWRPKLKVARRYDTRFYLGRAEADSTAEPDHEEAVSHLWASARSLLEQAGAGRHQIVFPTRRNLERLAEHPDFAAASAHARRIPAQTITPWVEQIDGRDWLCIPEGAGYPITSAPLAQALKELR